MGLGKFTCCWLLERERGELILTIVRKRERKKGILLVAIQVPYTPLSSLVRSLVLQDTHLVSFTVRSACVCWRPVLPVTFCLARFGVCRCPQHVPAAVVALLCVPALPLVESTGRAISPRSRDHHTACSSPTCCQLATEATEPLGNHHTRNDAAGRSSLSRFSMKSFVAGAFAG